MPINIDAALHNALQAKKICAYVNWHVGEAKVEDIIGDIFRSSHTKKYIFIWIKTDKKYQLKKLNGPLEGCIDK